MNPFNHIPNWTYQINPFDWGLVIISAWIISPLLQWIRIFIQRMMMWPQISTHFRNIDIGLIISIASLFSLLLHTRPESYFAFTISQSQRHSNKIWIYYIELASMRISEFPIKSSAFLLFFFRSSLLRALSHTGWCHLSIKFPHQ